MKKIAGLVLLGCVLLYSRHASAQTFAESALLFSRINPGGSARIQALGGTQVSLGGDYSSAFSNPAGLGMYNRSEFTFTPGFISTKTSSEYLGNTTPDQQSKIIVPGLSFVFHSDKNKGKLLGGTFGISINRINDFNRTFSYTGFNNNTNNGSIVDYFVGTANDYNRPPDELFSQSGILYNDPTGLAWDNYLVNLNVNATGPPYSADSVGTLNATNYFGHPTQHEQVQTKGSQYQVSISYGVNINDKLFLGGGVGITSLDYTSRKTYSESFGGDSVLSSMALAETLHTSGSGINVTIGAIYRPIDFFQAGFSVATPTIYSLNDTYSAAMVTNWRHFPYPGQTPPDGPLSTDQVLTTYALNTPWKLSGGLTFFILKHGFISADIDYISYGSNHYSSQTDGVDLSADNADIKDAYRSVFNYRIGAEYRWKQLRVRAGYSLMPDPYKAVQNGIDIKTQTISGGIGFRSSRFYVDLTALLPQSNSWYKPYTGAPLVTTSNKTTTVMVTVGFPF